MKEKIFLGIGVLILLGGGVYAYEKLIKNPKRSKEKNIDIPAGVVAAEFAKRELIKNPGDWKEALNKAKDLMTFEQKVNLTADLGGRMGNDYNYDRAGKAAII